MKSSITLRLLSSAALAGLAGWSGVAQAQSEPAPEAAASEPAPEQTTEGEASTGGLADIIVTARRTSERMQTTPVAVTALSNEALVDRQITNVSDLQHVAPSLSILSGGVGPATAVWMSMRGETVSDPGSFTDAPIATYIDGVYVARAVLGNLGFLDQGSVEVLRGPQGTLFGRNTTGGALNITTAAPVDIFEGYVKLGYGNYDSKLIEGVINVPLTDELATRFAARYDEHDGYFPNLSSGGVNGGIKYDVYLRGSARWEPKNLPIVWQVTGDYSRYRDTGNATALAAINPNGLVANFYNLSQAVRSGMLPANTPIELFPGFTVPAGSFAGFTQGPLGPIEQLLNPEFATDAQKALLLSQDWRTSFGNSFTGDPRIDEQGSYNKAWSVTSSLTVDIGDISVKSITGFRGSRSSSNLDITGTGTGALGFASYYPQHQFSEELQVSGTVGQLQFQFGGIYFREAGSQSSIQEIFYATPLSGPNTDDGDFVNVSKGLFTQLNYNITDELRVTGGIRYTWDKRSANIRSYRPDPMQGGALVCNLGPQAGQLRASQPGGECSNPMSAKFSYPAWTAGVDYKVTPDIFLYAKTSGASKSGGFNFYFVPPPFTSSFEPEHVRDVEIGFKGEFLNRRVRTNVALFHSWLSGLQRQIGTVYFDANNQPQVTSLTTNAGDARAKGIEFEGEVLPWEGMSLTGSFSYLDAGYKKGTRTEEQLIDGEVIEVDRSGEPLVFAPKWTANVGATQTFEMDAGTLKLHLDYAYTSARYYDYVTSGDPDPAVQAAVAINNQALRIRGVGLFNGQASFTFNDPNVEVAIWGRNIFNTPNFTNAYSTYLSLGTAVQFQGAPRTFGGTVTYRW